MDDTPPLESTWTLFTHKQSLSNNYSSVYDEAVSCSTIGEFWRIYNNVPTASDLCHKAVCIHNELIVAFSFFRKPHVPEWEDPHNPEGSEWGCRDIISCQAIDQMWLHVLLAAVGEKLRHTVGLRVVNKSTKLRACHKIEVWMNSCDDRCTRELFADLQIALQGIDTLPEFSFMEHNKKRQQATEYYSRRRVNHPRRTQGPMSHSTHNL